MYQKIRKKEYKGGKNQKMLKLDSFYNKMVLFMLKICQKKNINNIKHYYKRLEEIN